MKAPKIVFIGAGSMSFGIPTFRDIFSNKLLKGATLCLVDIDEENLDRDVRPCPGHEQRVGPGASH